MMSNNKTRAKTTFAQVYLKEVKRLEGNTHPATSIRDVAGRVLPCEMNWICLTTTESVWAAQYPALLDLAVGREHQPDVVLVALLGDHPDEQLSVLHG